MLAFAHPVSPDYIVMVMYGEWWELIWLRLRVLFQDGDMEQQLGLSAKGAARCIGSDAKQQQRSVLERTVCVNGNAYRQSSLYASS